MHKKLLVFAFLLISFPALAAEYELTDSTLAANAQQIIRTTDHASIPNDPRNRDYQAYLLWLRKGGKPDAATTQPPKFAKLNRN